MYILFTSNLFKNIY